MKILIKSLNYLIMVRFHDIFCYSMLTDIYWPTLSREDESDYNNYITKSIKSWLRYYNFWFVGTCQTNPWSLVNSLYPSLIVFHFSQLLLSSGDKNNCNRTQIIEPNCYCITLSIRMPKIWRLCYVLVCICGWDLPSSNGRNFSLQFSPYFRTKVLSHRHE